MGKKKIAVFSTVWNADYLYAFLSGLNRGAAERNADLYLFNTYGDSDKEYDLFCRGEYNVFFLPDLKEFDGALVASNNVGTRFWEDDLKAKIREAGVPCIGVEQEMGLDHFIGVDNYQAMYAMVEHLIRDKHCRVLNYVGGPWDNEENISRRQAFCDALAAYHIPCDPERMRDYSFGWRDGEQAYLDFKALGLEKTDAVVCASDYMAIGYLRSAAVDGLEAPRDFLITGFDNIREAQQYSPRITTVDRSQEELGYRCIGCLDDLIEHRSCPKRTFVPFRLVCSQSTGELDGLSSDEEFRRALFTMDINSQVMRLHLKHLRTSLLGNLSVADFMDITCTYAPLLGIHRFVMGLDAKKIVENSPRDMLYFGKNDGRFIRDDRTKNHSLIPEEFLAPDDRCHTYLFSPCHCSGKEFGYCVIIDHLEVVRENLLSEWMLTLDNAVEDLRQSLNLQIANRKLNELYRRDPMTGLFNRFVLDERGETLLRTNRELGVSTIVVFVDMDSLKRANDVYGHDMGDLALKAISEAVDRVCADYLDFAVRYGGDEFLLLGTYPGEEAAERIMAAVEAEISARAASHNIPFHLTASTGYAEITPDATDSLENHIRRADQHMYQNKQKKRKQ